MKEARRQAEVARDESKTQQMQHTRLVNDLRRQMAEQEERLVAERREIERKESYINKQTEKAKSIRKVLKERNRG